MKNQRHSLRSAFLGLVLGLASTVVPSQAATYTVTITNDSGAGSLRQAILDANANAGSDLIAFNIGSAGKTISVASALPGITDPVTIDGGTQPGFAGVPLVELNGASAGAGVDGLRVWASNTVIRALVINRFTSDGIEIATNGFNTVEGCYLGLGTDGTTDRGNTLSGLYITNSPNNTIGGLDVTNRNYISGNTQCGILVGGGLAVSNQIFGNVIGLDINSADKGNSQDGIRANAPSTRIGGGTTAHRNILAGNDSNGIQLGVGGTNSIVQGNHIGTDATATLERDNTANGIFLNAVAGCLIGGTNSGEGNRIVFNSGDGISVSGLTANQNLIYGNLIGTDAAGQARQGNASDGISLVSSARTNVIGGVLVGQANRIAFNGGDGVFMSSGTNNPIRGNFIHDNTGLGLDNGTDGVTANDNGDADTGANQLQNFPVLTAGTNSATEITVSGTLNSRTNATYTIDVYANWRASLSGNGEGRTWLGSTNVFIGATSNVTFELAFATNNVGHYLSATATDTNGNTSEFSATLRTVSLVATTNFTVVNTNDSGAGSLRQAIIDAHNLAANGTNTITFAIPGSGVQIINLASPLPTVGEPVFIDGYTQPGSSTNTLANGFNATVLIRLNGAGAGTGADGLQLAASGCTVRGLMITGFNGDGIELMAGTNGVIAGCVVGLDENGASQGNGANGLLINTAANTIGGTNVTDRNIIGGNTSDGIEITGSTSGNNVISGNFIGTDFTGTLDRGNTGTGILVTTAPGTRIGGATSAERNVIAGNGSHGISLSSAGSTLVLGNHLGTDVTGTVDVGNTSDGINASSATNTIIGGVNAGEGNLISGNNNDGIEITGVGATNVLVLGNRIGTDATGTNALGNTVHGVNFSSTARFNRVGGTGTGEANVIAFNTQDGIYHNGASNITFRANSIHSNGDLGIDLGTSGVTANDVGDADAGANLLQNFPVITEATNTLAGTFVSGTLNSAANATFALDFYANSALESSGHGEGQYYLGSTNVTTDGSGNATFFAQLAVTNLSGRYVSATATATNGSTSEFAAALFTQSAISGSTFTVVNTNDSGAGSWRQAILDANANVSAGDIIAFNIPGTAPFTIAPASPLPTITDPVTIDGYTQPGSVTNSSATAFNGAPAIRLVGTGAGSNVDGLKFTVGNNTVRGLVIINFLGDGLDFSGGGTNTVTGCLVGVDLDGSDQGNSGNGLLFTGSAGNLIGGTNAADRNVISGNTSDGLEITGSASGNVIQGNLIGLDLAGNTNRANNGNGILLTTATGTLIGGASADARNVIAGNTTHGISLSSAAGTVIQGNYLGTDVTGTIDRGNTSDGINANGATNSIIGGVNAGEGNLIAGNNNDGIEITGAGATNLLVLGNRIGTDVTGTNALGNGNHGIQFTTSARFNRVGGTGTGEANVIAFNTQDGIYHNGASNITFRANRIHSNGDLGIDLGTSGVTANDVGDADAGANLLQNFPVLSDVTNAITGTEVTGTLNSTASTTFTLDFYSTIALETSGHGEGQFYLGSTNVTTDGSGNATFLAQLAVTNLSGRYITATATDANGNTSEFGAAKFAQSTVSGSTFTVVNTNDSGVGSWRQAILDANANISAGDIIAFNIPGPAPFTIAPASPLPTIIDPVTIDGYTQPGSVTNSSTTAFNGAPAVRLVGTGAGSNVDGLKFTVGNNTVRGLVIINYLGDGLDFSGGGTNTVTGCLVGVDLDGSDQGNSGNGLLFTGSAGNQIGGTNAADRNVISGNASDGLEFAVGTNQNNVIEGNLIGTDLTGLGARGNTAQGILMTGASFTRIGGTNAGSRNIVAGNALDGIELSTGCSNAVIQGNYIGVAVNGTTALANDNGILNTSSGVLIGGTTPEARNIISGNQFDGILLNGLAANNCLIQGNYIGTDVTGTLDLGNGQSGVYIAGANFNTVGGSTAAERNLIAGNTDDGVTLASTSATNHIYGNWIGVGATGGALGNSAHGVLTSGTARGNRIGGVNAGEANRIAYNVGDGVYVSAGTNNAVRANLIAQNSGLAIDLGTSGLTTNDLNDADTGANQLQNFPVLTAATNDYGSVVIEGTLNSLPSTTFDLDFYAAVTRDSAGLIQGEQFLGSGTVTTDGSGNGAFSVTLPTSLTGRHVAATATDPLGNTSEFSLPLAAASLIPATNFVVTTTNDSGSGSLREAITLANAFISDGQDTIAFNIPGAGPHILQPATELPSLLDAVLIDGFTQPGAHTNSLCAGNNAVRLIQLDGSNAGSGVDGLTLDSAGASTVRGLHIVGFNNDGIEIERGNGHVIEGNVIGLTTGNVTLGNGQHGVHIASGDSTGNTIGGSSPGARNILSGQTVDGLRITSSSSNTVAGNFIGTDLTGMIARPNFDSGIYVTGNNAVGNVIGGGSGCARNVIAGNGTGSDDDGVRILAAVGTQVLGNYIGVDVTGTNLLANYWTAVSLESGATQTQIGGTNPGEGNVLAGSLRGVMILSSHTNTVVGNLIGTDATGTRDFGNSNDGIEINASRFNTIGGPSAAARNVISGNGVGIDLNSSVATNNVIQGNYIGTDLTGTNALPNSTGISIAVSARDNLIGGTNVNEGNLIAYNFSDGVSVTFSAIRNTIVGNSLHSNAGLGIDLEGNGVTANDTGDADSGGNDVQNYPVLAYAASDTNNLAVIGTLNSGANQTYLIDFYANDTLDTTGYGEGKTYLGRTQTTTDGSGNATVEFNLNPAPAFGQFITATATTTNGSTSEFSAGATVVPHDAVDLVLSLTDSADPAAAVTGFDYLLTITNRGPTNATAVFVTNTLPAGFTLASATLSQGTYTNVGNVVICELGTLNFSSNAAITLTVNGAAVGLVTNTAVIVSAETDHQPTNNLETETTFVGIANLSVTVTDSADPVVAGQPLTYTAVITNAGPDAATGVSLNLNSSSSAVYVNSTTTQGTVTPGYLSASAALGTILPNAAATVTLTIIPLETGTDTGHAEGYSSLQADQNILNNSADEITTVAAGPGVMQFTSTAFNGAEGDSFAIFSVQRTGGSLGTVTVDYATADLTATGGTDYIATNGTLTFLAGETSQSILVPLIDDLTAECNEALQVTLSNPSGGAVVLGQTNATAVLADDELTLAGTLSPVSLGSTNLPAHPGPDDSQWPSISGDGRYVVFASGVQNLVTNDFTYQDDIFIRDRLTDTTALVSVNQTGTNGGNGYSYYPKLSGDGQHVVFVSDATDLVTITNGGYNHIYHRNLTNQTTTLISVNTNGAAANYYVNLATGGRAVSTNGQVVLFESSATDLVPGVSVNNGNQIYARHLGSNQTWLVSINQAGTGDSGYSYSGALSEDGRYAIFASQGNTLDSLDTDTQYDVFRRDLVTGTTTLISVNQAGTASGNDDSGDYVALSGDGRYVAFDSYATDLTTNSITGFVRNTYWRDTLLGETRLVSVSTNGINGATGAARLAGLSRDGRYVLFDTSASNLVTNDNNTTDDVFLRDVQTGNTTLISVNQSGTGAGSHFSEAAGLSADGRYVVFVSDSTNLTSTFNPTVNQDVFVRDTVSGTTTQLSTRYGVDQAAEDYAYEPVISSDATVVAFTSYAEDIIPVDGNFDLDVFARDVTGGGNELVSASLNVMGNDYSFDHALNTNGSVVAFASYAGNLVTNDNFENSADIFLRHVTNGTTTLISVNTNGVAANSYSDLPRLNAAGNVVAFYSEAQDLVSQTVTGSGDIYHRDITAGLTRLVSVATNGTSGSSSGAYDPEISSDGRYVIFESGATNLSALDDNPLAWDIYLRDLSNSICELITVNGTASGSGNGDAYDPALSADGRYVAFETYANNLGPADAGNILDLYVRDRLSGSNMLCSVNTNGTGGGNDQSFDAVVSANGRMILFESIASDLAAGDNNGTTDIFAYDTWSNVLHLVSANLANSGAGNGQSLDPAVSADGRYVAFQSLASDLIAGDTNNATDIFVRDLQTGTTTLISGNCDSGQPGNSDSYDPSISDDGRYVAFESYATDLTAGRFATGQENIYRRDRQLGTTELVSYNRFQNGGGNGNAYYALISADGTAVAFAAYASDLVAFDGNINDDIFVWNGSAALVVTVNLVTTKAATSAAVTEGDLLAYTLTVTNAGSGTATGVQLTDVLPTAMTFSSATASVGTATNNLGTVNWNLGSLTSGAGASLTITVTAVTPGNTTNTASATANETDTAPANNTASATVLINAVVPPTLSVVRTNANLILRWPTNTSPLFALETKTNLLPAFVWSPVTNSVIVVGTNNTVTLTPDPTERTRFYRLKK
jgi:uncharacterized repeat protein (TIGR01451 family)